MNLPGRRDAALFRALSRQGLGWPEQRFVRRYKPGTTRYRMNMVFRWREAWLAGPFPRPERSRAAEGPCRRRTLLRAEIQTGL
jgi:hypothetical protein